MWFKPAFSLLGLAALARCATQQSFEPYDAGLFIPLGELSALSTSEFTTLRHPAFSEYSVRIKQTRFCETTAGSVPLFLALETFILEG